VALLKPPVRRHRGQFSIHLNSDQAELLLRLLDELASMLSETNLSETTLDGAAPENAERIARLFPPAFTPSPDYTEQEAEYQRLMRDELVQSRLASIATVRDCLANPRHLTEAQITGFMQAVNALRLVLGTILEITDDPSDPDQDSDLYDQEPSPDDPNFGLHVAYQFLSWVLEWTVTALSR
jgi:hypothetical protein